MQGWRILVQVDVVEIVRGWGLGFLSGGVLGWARRVLVVDSGQLLEVRLVVLQGPGMLRLGWLLMG